MTETWKTIPGYDGRYEVSSFGKVRSLYGRVNPLKVPKILRLTKYTSSQTEYYRVELSNPSKTYLVHRLVAITFLPNLHNKPCVNHIDNNGLNNEVTNLEWVTHSENLVHAQKQGRLTHAQSKGGVTSSDKAKEMAYQNALSLVGTKVNDWFVASYAGKTKIGTLERESLNCVCKCGTPLVIEATRLLLRKPTMCKKCASIQKSYKRYNELRDLYIGKEVGPWNVYATSVFNPAETTKQMQFHATCITCNYNTILTQPSVIGSKPLKPCPQCRDNSKLKI